MAQASYSLRAAAENEEETWEEDEGLPDYGGAYVSPADEATETRYGLSGRKSSTFLAPTQFLSLAC